MDILRTPESDNLAARFVIWWWDWWKPWFGSWIQSVLDTNCIPGADNGGGAKVSFGRTHLKVCCTVYSMADTLLFLHASTKLKLFAPINSNFTDHGVHLELLPFNKMNALFTFHLKLKNYSLLVSPFLFH